MRSRNLSKRKLLTSPDIDFKEEDLGFCMGDRKTSDN